MTDHFWLPGTASLPTLEEAWVAAAEAALGVRLPSAYVELLRVQNGGGVRYDTHPTTRETSWAEDHVPFPDMLGIGRPGSSEGILSSPGLCREWELPEGLVLLSGDGHHWIALDYREGGAPAVTWLDDEGDALQLAPDFEEFVDGLVRGDAAHVYGFADADVQHVRDELARALAVTWAASVFGGWEATHGRLLDGDGEPALLQLMANSESEFPEHPEMRWLLRVEVAEDQASLLGELLRFTRLDKQLLHTPPWSEG